MRTLRGDQSGQAILEYVLLLSIVVSTFVAVQKALNATGLAKKLMEPISRDYAMAYQYGHPKAKGPDDGGPTFHPRVVGGEGNFRLFTNPEFK